MLLLYVCFCASFLFSIMANLQGKMGNQAGSLKKHIETAEKTGLHFYHFELWFVWCSFWSHSFLIPGALSFSDQKLEKFPPELTKVTWSGEIWSSSVLFRLSGIWETSICPATRSSYCLRTLGRSKCWKRSQCQRINWIAYHRWKILHLKCFKSLWSLNTNLTLNLRTLASWRSWRT